MRVLFRIGLIASIPLVATGVILMGNLALKSYHKDSLLNNDCHACLIEIGVLRKPEREGAAFIEFIYKGATYKAISSLESSLVKEYIGKKVKVYFDIDNPSFNRIDLPEENEMVGQYLTALIVCTLVLGVLVLVVVKTKKKVN